MLFNAESLRSLRAKPDKRGPNAKRGDATQRKTGFGGHARDNHRRHEPADQNDTKDEKA